MKPEVSENAHDSIFKYYIHMHIHMVDLLEEIKHESEKVIII